MASLIEFKEYLLFLGKRHRATREVLIREGKSYRSLSRTSLVGSVAYENGYLMALQDIIDAIELPEKNAKLKVAMSAFAEKLNR